MNTTIIILGIALIALCLLLMRRILKLEYQVFDLNEKLNLSDAEYIDLFDENIKLSKKIENTTKTNWYYEKLEERMNIIGQNGNEGTHYENEK